MMALSSPDIPPEEDLVAAGWERRSMLSMERIAEAESIYLDLGLEVLIRKPDEAHFGANCQLCKEQACSEYRVIYTREKRP